MIRILINQCKDILKHRSRIQSKAEMQESAFEDSGYIDCEWKEVLSCLDENTGSFFFCITQEKWIQEKSRSFWISAAIR